MDFEVLRERMVDEQLIPRGIRNARVLDAFRKVPRHIFVPDELSDSAYADYPLPIGKGQTISQPYMIALMTESLNLVPGEKVLEVGTGSGYQLAILLEILGQAYSVEKVQSLAEEASGTLKKAGYDNFSINVGDGTLGWEDEAPFDAILVTAAAPKAPDSLLGQLKYGGRMAIPVGGRFSQVLTLFRKEKTGLSVNEICGCVFVPLIGREGWEE